MCNIWIMEIPEREERNKQKKIFETIVTKNFPKIKSDTKLQIQELRIYQAGSDPGSLALESVHVPATFRAQVQRSQIQERQMSTEISNNVWVIYFLNLNKLNYFVFFKRVKLKL